MKSLNLCLVRGVAKLLCECRSAISAELLAMKIPFDILSDIRPSSWTCLNDSDAACKVMLLHSVLEEDHLDLATKALAAGLKLSPGPLLVPTRATFLAHRFATMGRKAEVEDAIYLGNEYCITNLSYMTKHRKIVHVNNRKPGMLLCNHNIIN